jgi:putative ABC transport system permease protein
MNRDFEIDRELRFHIEQQIDDYVRRGMSRVEATRRTHLEFGGVQQVKEECRDAVVVRWWDDLSRDLRSAIRGIRKLPGSFAAAIATLALGIGTATAMFSVVDAVLIRPLAYPESDRLVVINESVPRVGAFPANAVHVEWWRADTTSFQDIATIAETTMNVSGFGDPESITGARVSANLFSILGVRMQLGRPFTPKEDLAGNDRVVVLDDALWRRRFGANPHVIGQTIRLDDLPYEIVGVLPRDFHFPALRDLVPLPIPSDRPQFWKPFGLAADERTPIGAFNNITIAKLAPGVALTQARVEMEREQAAVSARLPQRVDLHASVVPLRDQIVGRSRAGLQVLLTAIAIVLLIGCINVANLLLVASLGEQHELGVRAAIGASRTRLARQTLTQSMALVATGGVGAILVAYVTIRLILAAAPADVPRLDEVTFDSRAWMFAIAVSALVALLVGTLPALRAASARLADALGRRPGGSTTSAAASRTRAFLVAGEVGLSAVCLIAAGLLFHSLVNLLSVDKGFDATNVLTAALRPPEMRYPNLDARAAFELALYDRLSAIPGVSGVALANQLPLRGIGGSSALSLEGTTVPPLERPIADVRTVNPEYFRTWNVPMRMGRMFGYADRDRRVAVVSEYTARHAWPGSDPIGKRVRFGTNPAAPLFEVIGVVADIRGINLDQAPAFAVYVPYWQRDSPFILLAIKTVGDPEHVAGAMRAAVHAIDADLPVAAVRTMDTIEALSTAQRRFQLVVIVTFAIASTLLAGVGLYGVLAYAVRQRTSEIGTRLALGAQPSTVWTTVVTDALRLAGAGLLGGVPLGLLGASILRGLLFGVSPCDPLTVASVCIAISITAWLAAYVPARRASRIDPLVALRAE